MMRASAPPDGFPNADNETMQLHLNEISRHVAKEAVAGRDNPIPVRLPPVSILG
jgi:hypothetical protein